VCERLAKIPCPTVVPYLSYGSDMPPKHIYDLWIELRPSSLPQLGKRHIDWKRRTIDTIRGHSVERIGHRDDASAQRNALALETVWVS
jgi:hypothetical protein